MALLTKSLLRTQSLTALFFVSGLIMTPPLYIVAWGINYQRHYWAQGHYFLEDFKAACDYLNGEENKNENSDHYVPLKDFLCTLVLALKSQFLISL